MVPTDRIQVRKVVAVTVTVGPKQVKQQASKQAHGEAKKEASQTLCVEMPW
jgi:hypothetical protein